MRIGTWNLDARWSTERQSFLHAHACDIWLLTEVSPRAVVAGEIGGIACCLSPGVMSRGQHYAAVVGDVECCDDESPHPAAAFAKFRDIVVCSSVLPWGGCRSQPGNVWEGESLREMAEIAVRGLEPRFRPTESIWGGDWNQNLDGRFQGVGCEAMRTFLDDTTAKLGLVVATRDLPHKRGAGLFSIDHVAVPKAWRVISAAKLDVGNLSDHDAYVVEAELAST